MLSLFTVQPHTLELLKRLQTLPQLAETRLVGGTALALQYGHRESIDLDLFGNIICDISELREEMREIGELKIIYESQNINHYILDNIKIDVIRYKYSWIDEVVECEGLRLASPKDIAAMKLNAIIGRGTKKDFVDLYFLLQQYTLDDIIEFYKLKYPDHNLFQAILSMTYFVDAEPQQMPKMHITADWSHIKSYIQGQVANYQLIK